MNKVIEQARVHYKQYIEEHKRRTAGVRCHFTDEQRGAAKAGIAAIRHVLKKTAEKQSSKSTKKDYTWI